MLTGHPSVSIKLKVSVKYNDIIMIISILKYSVLYIIVKRCYYNSNISYFV